MIHYYFSYGANTNLDSMASRCPDAIVLGPALLKGYRLVFRLHADIELYPDCEVNGLLWAIDDYHLEDLDMFEGFPNYYLRQQVRVEHENQQFIAWVYTMSCQDYYNAPQSNYFDLCVEGYQQNGINTQQLFDAYKRFQ